MDGKSVEAKIINAGNCMLCGKPIEDGTGIFLCRECEKTHRIEARRNTGMTNHEAIKWLFMAMNKGVEFDDYSEETKDIREAAAARMNDAFAIAISELYGIGRGGSTSRYPGFPKPPFRS